MTNTAAASELEELRQELAYLRKIAEQSVARMLTVETQAVAIRHELEQKRRGFSLMADLAVNIKHGADYALVFASVAQRINAALNMQHTVVLRPEPDGRFRPSIIQGYPAEDMKKISALRLRLDDELLSPRHTRLITGADPPARLAGFRKALDLPFFIAAPIHINNQTVAVLVTGRQAEQPPFLPRLGHSDVETVQTLAAYLTFMSTGQRLEEEEAEKRDLEEIMRTFFTASVDGYIIWDSERITRVSPGTLKLLGAFFDPGQDDGEHLSLNREHLNTVFTEVLRNGRLREELFLRSSAGELIPCEITHLPLRLHNSTCLLSYIRDLRGQKAHEKELLAAKEKAEAAAVAKSQFLANISHEIRTPMNAISGFTHILKDSLDPDGKRAEYVYGIEDAANTLMRIVNDILSFSQIEAGKLLMEHSPFSLKKALEAVMALNRPLADSKGLSFILEKRLKEDDPWVMGDSPRLQQVLNNLIGNALKFTDEGAVTVSVENLPESGRPGFTFTVHDTGIGVSPEKMAGIFEAFSQADGSSTRKHGGVGLGLPIAKQLVERFGGRISCESSPNRGSTFRFTAFFDAVRTMEARPAPLAGQAKNKPLKIEGRILLVEDNAVNQLVAQKIMEKAGLSVQVADNGRIALEMIEAEPFDLVLMDIQMPEMDGLTATRHIRANPKFDRLPIVAMTAHAQESDKDLSLNIGMNAHITKPINIQELFAVLSQWMPKASLGAAMDDL